MTNLFDNYFGAMGSPGSPGSAGADTSGTDAGDGGHGGVGGGGEDVTALAAADDSSLDYTIVRLGGDGGSGGSGGPGGAVGLVPSVDYVGGVGGVGGAGGAGGNSDVTVGAVSLYSLTIGSYGGNGGAGVTGGDGGSGYVGGQYVDSASGAGGVGGAGGDASVVMTGGSLYGETLYLNAYGGDGGHGGRGGGQYSTGAGGIGGRGGMASISISASTFAFANYLTLSAEGGSSGDSGDNGPSGSATAGVAGGEASVSLLNNTFTGIGTDDYFYFNLNLAGGLGGHAGRIIPDVSTGSLAATGDTDLMVSGNIFDGGAGTDLLALNISDDGLDDIAIDRTTQTLSINGHGNTLLNVERFEIMVSNSDGSSSSATVHYTGNADYDYIRASTGNDVLNGAGGGDVLYGQEGDDTLNGGDGGDDLHGGIGNDTLNGGAGDDYIDAAGWGKYSYPGAVYTHIAAGVDHIDGGAGMDEVVIDKYEATYDISFDMDLMKTGMTMADGTTIINVEELAGLTTGSGNDTLTIRAVTGIYVWQAGAGTDTLIIDLSNTNSTLTTGNSASGDGIRRYTYAMGHTTGPSYIYDVEQVKLTGGSANDSLQGLDLQDILIGNAGDDYLDGGGGADIMKGGAGDDTYYVDSAGDTITELAGEGTDTVYVSASYTLAANIENAFAYDATTAISLTGNASANQLRGGDHANALLGMAGNDTLTGGNGNDVLDGGTGNDAMEGGAGDDTYYVDSANDVLIELSNNGTDKVIASVSYDLTLFYYRPNVENLTLTGTGNINGIGNDLDNILIGNSGNNILDGKSGADTMIGGLGDDTYYVDNAGDVVTEYANGGTDTVISTVSFTTGSSHIENVILASIDAINATGNSLDNRLVGNANNNILNGNIGADTMIGGEGDDTYYVDNALDVVTEYANSGLDTVISSVSFTTGSSHIENVTLTGTAAINATGNSLDNVLTGNSGANILMGGNGNDMLKGGVGADTLVGGLGDDTYYVDNAADIYTELAGQGNDTIIASVAVNLGNNFENLTLTGVANLDLIGNAAINVLNGNAGNNILDGKAGADTMMGGLGNDTYYVDNELDRVYESTGGGTDQVFSSASFNASLTAVENITLTGNADISVWGNDQANILVGNTGRNYLTGGGGIDHLIGGAGDDTYYIDSSADIIIEQADEGYEYVYYSGSYTLGQNVEGLILTGNANVNGLGNASDNALHGNDGVNILTGLAGNDSLDGGLGADIMRGGIGNDVYAVDNVGDVVTELNETGIDWVVSTIGYVLTANVENLVLDPYSAANLNGTGNALDNGLIGNEGNNTLNGGAGNDELEGRAGADTLIGGLGDDRYYVDNVGDTVIEYASQGTDIVYSTVTFSLGGQHIENLTLKGTGNINAGGNSLANILTGNSGNNILTGAGGNDTLTGGLGADIFFFGAGIGADVITDFSAAQNDKLNLHAYSQATAIFTQVGADTVIDLGGGNKITVLNAVKADVSSHVVW